MAGRDGAGTIPLGKELEEGDGIRVAEGESVEAQGCAEVVPQGPTGIGCSAALSRGAVRGRLLQSAPVSDALVAERRGCSRQEEVWGYRELK